MTYLTLPDSRWRTFVEERAQDCFYYSQAWFELITQLYGSSVIPLTTTNSNGEITGFLPLCLMQSPLTGRRLVGLPFSDHCPLLAVDEISANTLIDQALGLAQEKRVRYLELRTGTHTTLGKRRELAEGNLYVRWLLPLADDADSMWAGLRKPIQRQIKKSESLGVQVRVATRREDVALYYRLHLHTRTKRHGMPAQPLGFFYGLWDAFAARGAMQLLLAEYEGTVIAGMVVLAAGTTARYAYGASDERHLKMAPNNLLMWRAIRWACSHGYQTLDMGRTAYDNEGLMEFKRRWGAIKEPLPYYYYPQIGGLAATSEHSWKFRTLTRCWQRLPLEIAGPLGGYLYKHLG